MEIPFLNFMYLDRVKKVLEVKELPDDHRRQLEAVKFALENIEQCSGFYHLEESLLVLEERYGIKSK